MQEYVITVDDGLIKYFREFHNFDSTEIMLSKMLMLLREILEVSKNGSAWL